MSDLAAVLFDMDGTLVDSERMWIEVEGEVVAELGGTWGPEHQANCIGGSMLSTGAYIAELTGTPLSPREVGERLNAGMLARLRTDVPLMPGAKELLTALDHAGVPCALVTSTYRELLEAALEGIGREHFAVTVAGDEVTNAKPDPEPYVRAARRLGVSPQACVAVEDSPNGVASAQAAGCLTVAVPNEVAIPPAPRRVVIGSLAELSLDRLRGLAASGGG